MSDTTPHNNHLGILNADDQAALDILSTRQADMVERTLEWARINTGSWNTQGLLELAPRIAESFEELDAHIERVPTDPIETIGNQGEAAHFQSGPIIRISARPHAPRQVVMSGHYDTVFPPGTFEDVKDLGNGRLNGPGLADMKGGIVVMLEALKAFEQGALKDQLGYQIVLTPDEETGNFASAPYLTAAAQKAGAHIGMSFEPAMETGDMAGARKGSASFDLVFQGLASHAGRAPEAGRSALLAAAECVTGIEALTPPDGVSINIGRIDGGGAINIVPDLAIIRLGARAPDAETAEWAQTHIQAVFEKALTRDGIRGHMHGGFYRPPKPRTAAQQALFHAVTSTGEALGLSIDFIDTGGVCEGNNIFAAGVPNIDTLGVRGGRIHSSEEFVITESFVERAGLAALLLNRLADGRIDGPYIKSLMKADQ